MKRRELIRLLHASGTRSAAPDLETGYGIPQCAAGRGGGG